MILATIIFRYILIPEKYIYGHHHDYKFLEFLFIVIVIPASVALFYIAKTANKDKAIGIGILFVAFGFVGLLLSTFIEKALVSYQINTTSKTIIGKINYTYLQRAGSRSSGKIQYHFVVSFDVNNTNYYSLPGFTDEEKYKIGDTITVHYLPRNPFLNEITYSE